MGAEFALVSARRTQIEPRAEAGSRMARTTLRAMENMSLVIGGQPARHHGLLAGPRCRRRARAWRTCSSRVLEAVHVPESLLHPVAFVVGLAIVVYLHVVLGEMIPKNIALAGPDRAALVLGHRRSGRS